MSRKKLSSGKLWTNIIILAAFMLVLISCANILRSILWKNTNEMGLSLVRNYSSVEEQNMKTCEVILNVCANYIAERERTDISLKELRDGLYPFMDGLINVYGKEKLQVYGRASGNSALLSNAPEIEALADYDVTSTQWYQGAAAANGETYVSPVYTDKVTGLPVVTMCRVIPETGSFLAIDIKPSDRKSVV